MLSGVLRAGLAQIRVLDLKKSIEFYAKHLGLDEVGYTADGRFMLKAYDEFDHHSVVLREAHEPGIDLFGFKCLDEATVDRIKAETIAFGFPVEEIAANSDQPGFGRRIDVLTSTGHHIQFFSQVEMAAQHPQFVNPHIWGDTEPHGMAPARLDHCLLYGVDAQKTFKWFTDVVGFKMTETVEKEPGGDKLVCWLSGSTRGHDIAVLDFDKPGKLHHVGFHLEDWSAVGHAADIMGRNHIPIDIGPTRHGITRGQTIYFFDPSGNRLETFSGGYTYYPDMPTRVWDMDHVGEGIFYYDKKLNERFLSVYT